MANANKFPSEDRDTEGTYSMLKSAKLGKSVGCAWDVSVDQLNDLNP